MDRTLRVMKFVDIVLSLIIVLSATVFTAYVSLYYGDFGLLKTLPDDISDFFIAHHAIQHLALGLLIAAVAAKVPTGRAIRRYDAHNRI
jgi:hypothetical protein